MSKPDLRLYNPEPLDFDLKPTLPFPTRWPTDPKVEPVTLPPSPNVSRPALSPPDFIDALIEHDRRRRIIPLPLPTGAPMEVLSRLEEVIARAKARNVAEGEILSAVKKVIHSPLVALLVRATPNAVDDMVLETLKALFPLAA